MPDAKTSPQDTPDLDAQIEALLADMASACDRVAQQLEDRPPPEGAGKAGGAVDDRGQRVPPTPASEPGAAEATGTDDADDAAPETDADASTDPEEEEAHADASEFDLGPEPSAGGESDEAAETAQAVALDAQVGDLIDAASGVETPESAGDAPVDGASAAPESESLDAAEQLGDLDAELAALAGEMMAESEPFEASSEPVAPTPDDTTPATGDPDPDTETSEDVNAGMVGEARGGPSPAAAGTAGGVGSASGSAPRARGSRPSLPARPATAPGSKPWVVAWAYAKVYVPWLGSVVFAQAMRLFIWAMPRLGDLAERSNKPIEGKSRIVRQSVGWFAVTTAFYALLAWVFVLFIREPPQPTAPRTPAVEVRDPNAPVPVRPTPSAETPPR
ncbi:MAG: hypothetical protein EA378_03500 [Phycisphaerales bacterium]|nr:MAG: hypothetical protein EA378_03500 [Phycisphaerales bacterium]